LGEDEEIPFHHFFYIRIIFCYQVEEGPKMYFLNDYLGGLRTEKMKTNIQTNIPPLSNLTPS